MSQGHQRPLKGRKGRATNSSLEHLKGMQPCPLVFDFDLWICVLTERTRLMEICTTAIGYDHNLTKLETETIIYMGKRYMFLSYHFKKSLFRRYFIQIRQVTECSIVFTTCLKYTCWYTDYQQSSLKIKHRQSPVMQRMWVG